MFPIDGAKLMKPKIDLVSMFLVNANGRSPIPVVKKRKQWRSSRRRAGWKYSDA